MVHLRQAELDQLEAAHSVVRKAKKLVHAMPPETEHWMETFNHELLDLQRSIARYDVLVAERQAAARKALLEEKP